jgi:hypothetical protein
MFRFRSGNARNILASTLGLRVEFLGRFVVILLTCLGLLAVTFSSAGDPDRPCAIVGDRAPARHPRARELGLNKPL